MEKATLLDRIVYTLRAKGHKPSQLLRGGTTTFYALLMIFNLSVMIGGTITGMNVASIVVNSVLLIVNVGFYIFVFSTWEHSDLRRQYMSEDQPPYYFRYVKR